MADFRELSELFEKFFPDEVGKFQEYATGYLEELKGKKLRKFFSDAFDRLESEDVCKLLLGLKQEGVRGEEERVGRVRRRDGRLSKGGKD